MAMPSFCCWILRRLIALLVCASVASDSAQVRAAWSTIVNNGSPANRVDIVFVGDGYTRSDLNAGLYAAQVDQYLGYMFGASGFLADPFPRYKNFFNVHQIDVESAQSGADHPSQGIFRSTALDATYEASGIARLLTISNSKANTVVDQNLAGSGITADIRLATVNDPAYGGSGGTWAVFSGANGEARDLGLHELSHAFSDTADEYVTQSGTYPFGEPLSVNATRDPAGAKWSQWLGFADPRADFLGIDVFAGAADYPLGIFRPSLDSKMRTLGRPFNALVREKTILDIYQHLNPLDAWLGNGSPNTTGELWVDAIDPEVILVDWYVNGQLVAPDYGEQFELADFVSAAGMYTVRARAYDEAFAHAGDGCLLDLVRTNLNELEQNVTWTVNFAGVTPIAGDFNLDGAVDDGDLLVWQQTFGSTVALAADGNKNGFVDAADYTVWRNNVDGFPGSASFGGPLVPEPGISTVMLTIMIAVACGFRLRSAGGTVSPSRRCV